MRRRLTYAAQALLVGRAVRPIELLHVILYSSPFEVGLRAAGTWSPDGLDCVKGGFLNDFYDKRPRVLLHVCPGPN